MKKRLARAFNFFRVLSLWTYLWCIGVIAGTSLLCMSFFMAEPLDRQIIVTGRAIQPADTATDFDETLVVKSLSKDNLIDNSYDYKLLMDNAISKEDAFEPGPSYIIATGSSEETALEASQADDGSLSEDTDLLCGKATATAPFSVEKVEESELPDLGEVSLNCSVSIADYLALCQIVEAEARSEDIYGKRLVANVILNRTESLRYPDSIENVILDKGQFDPVENGVFYKTVPTEDSKYAVMTALNGENESQDALFFQRSASSVWGDKTFLFRYGSHSFYR